MAALITEIIPAQNFESIRDKIGAILALELAAQTYTADVTVWNERTLPFQPEELPAVNVTFDSTPYDNINPKTRRGTNQYFIDIYVQKKSSTYGNGDTLASTKCSRITGIVAYILSHPLYCNLGYTPGLIQSRFVSNINIEKIQESDSLHTVVGKVTYTVIANESLADIAGKVIDEIHSSVQIEETDLGFKYEVINT